MHYEFDFIKWFYILQLINLQFLITFLLKLFHSYGDEDRKSIQGSPDVTRNASQVKHSILLYKVHTQEFNT